MRKKKQTNKQKKTGIHPSFTCIKCGFDHKAFLECCKGFQSIQGPGLSPLGWKIKIFKKLKKYPQGFPQTLSVPSFRQIWPFMPSLEHPKACSTYRHTDKDTETETDIDTHTHTHTHTESGSSSTEVENSYLLFIIQPISNKQHFLQFFIWQETLSNYVQQTLLHDSI